MTRHDGVSEVTRFRPLSMRTDGARGRRPSARRWNLGEEDVGRIADADRDIAA
ncbi:hypothetical protein P8A22_34300 [Streptomyces laculatispora]|uniref:Uncharacterized protein n=1 Tax=Streptomyces laculatispora TaxID=887464 RepID=A0ABY9IE71_9ACTN|nr:hypothetical protein [Streptomyces laculatispora]WLQ44534.1 hypothetical protein P8A22_34300 [Streptomyces laculatispora]